MSFPSYLEYKDSGIEWLGRVPEHWQIKALRYLSVCLDGKRIPLNGEQRADKQGDIPYWGANAIMDYVDEAIFDEELLLVGEDGAPFLDPLKPVAFHSSGPVWPNNHIHVLRPNKREWVRFLVYAMNAADYANYIEGSTRQKLNQSRLMGMPVSWPGYTEQTQIARFLDHETARIDELIEEQQRLIELLKEKRQAVISRAVTKGLDPTVPMKDSGVEWLGEVPAHWVVSRAKNVVSFITSGPRGWSDYIDESGEDIFLQSGDMDNRLNVLFDKAKRITTPEGAEGVRTRVREGDVFVCITGANTGRVAVVKELPGISYVNQHLGLLRPQVLSCDSRYLGYALSSTNCQTYFSVEQYGLKEGLSLTDLAEAPLMVPTIAEQVALVNSIEEQLSNLDRLSVDAERAAELLTERRSALISAAVTGKIDVRGWQPPTSAPTPELAKEAV